MSAPPRWISKAALLLLHEESIATFGGARGLRDEGLLDSALARPRNAHAYHPEKSISELAAIYAYGLARHIRSLTATNGWPFYQSASFSRSTDTC